jgi:50S ribosomal subunit-associated GTPase HflX
MADHWVEEWAPAVAISALDGTGIDNLFASIIEMIKGLLTPMRICIPYDRSKLVEDCYQFGRVLSVSYEETGIIVEVDIVTSMRGMIAQYEI